jgi:transcriptional regulator with XRE-family HTH domain
MARVREPIANRLRKYRKQMGYDQKLVARKLGLKCTSQISRWEEGKSMPSVINLLKLSIIYCRLPTDLYLDIYIELKAILIKDTPQH